MKWKGLLVVALLLAAFVFIVLSSMSISEEACVVCISYNGRMECRKASAATREEATRTAGDNACALLASGMTDTIACSNTLPSSVICE